MGILIGGRSFERLSGWRLSGAPWKPSPAFKRLSGRRKCVLFCDACDSVAMLRLMVNNSEDDGGGDDGGKHRGNLNCSACSELHKS